MLAHSLPVINALVTRHLQALMRDPWQLLNILYKSLLDLVLIGYIGIAQQKMVAGCVDCSEQLLVGIILWSIVMRTSFSAIHGMLVDVWSGNIVALFATPMRLSEWIISLMIYALFMVAALIVFLSGMSYILFNFVIFKLGWIMLLLIAQFYLYGVALGIALVGLLFYSGVRGQSLVFMVGYLFVPFVGAYYPVTVLPGWMQTISYGLAPRYFFEFVRQYLATGEYLWDKMLVGSVLNVVTLIVATLFLYNRYHRSTNEGIARLLD